MEILTGLNSSSGLTRDTHESAKSPSRKEAIPTWQMLAKSALAVSTSITTKSMPKHLLGVKDLD
jgi:hypothetical protein